MADSTDLCGDGAALWLRGSATFAPFSARLYLHHKREFGDWHLLGYRFRDARADRYCFFTYLRDGAVQCDRLLAAACPLDCQRPP